VLTPHSVLRCLYNKLTIEIIESQLSGTTISLQKFFWWPPCVADVGIIFCSYGSYLSSSFFLLSFSPILSGQRLDVYHTLPHTMWPWCEFRMHVWNGLLVACWNTGRKNCAKKSPPAHHHTSLSGYILATKACIDNQKKTCQTAISTPHVLTIWWTLAY